MNTKLNTVRDQVLGGGESSSSRRHLLSPAANNTQKNKTPIHPGLPLPVSVELHNVFPKIRIPAKKWFRPEYTTELLYEVRMEITVVAADDDDVDKQRTMYASIDSRRTIGPSWLHLADSIQYQELAVSEYESMKARFSVVDDDAAAEAKRSPHFLETHLHPSKLCRIAKLPPNLPLNCTVVRFSDDSVRVHPAHYQLLLDSRQVGVAVVVAGTNVSSSLLDVSQETSRFEDNVFNALDSVTPAASPRREIVEEAMNVFKDIPSSILMETDAEPVSAPESAVLFNGDVCHASVFDGDDSPENGICAATGMEGYDFDLQLLAFENESLEKLIEAEEHALERDTTRMQAEKELLSVFIDDIRTKEEQNLEVAEAIQAERTKILKVEFILEAQRIRLVRELSIIYPITVERDQRYYIRGLEIPFELYSKSVSEEVLSAALGFLCHLVQLLSKYLGVHLRYRLYCQSSRCAVQDERTATFPLFQGRAVEREQLEYGVHLLDRNIKCICQARGIQLPLNLHILAQTLRIYENVVEGY